jgi:hypothetical protein
VSLAARIAAVVLFVLAAIGVTFGSIGELDLIAAGLAAFVLSTLVPD